MQETTTRALTILVLLAAGCGGGKTSARSDAEDASIEDAGQPDAIVEEPGDAALPNGAWAQLAGGPPSQESGHAMVYDKARRRVVLLGRGATMTWEWDAETATWMDKTPSPFPDRFGGTGFALAYDDVQQRVLVFGGQDSSGQSEDLWEWDGTTWSNVTPATPPTPLGWPAPRHGHGMAYDSANSKVLVLYGCQGRGFPPYHDLWERDSSSGVWSNRTPRDFQMISWPPLYDTPPYNACPVNQLIYDPVRRRAVSYGLGVNGVREIWEWDGSVWTNPDAPGEPSSGGTFAYAGRGRSIFIKSKSDHWLWDGTTWTPIVSTSTPPARVSAAAVYVDSRDSVLVFGGSGPDPAAIGRVVPLADTWEFRM